MAAATASRPKEPVVTPRPPRRARLLAACAVLAAGLALTGCSAHPGRAVFGQYTGLDGTTRTLDVSEARFAAVTEELAVTRENPVKLLQALALAPVYIEVGEKYGVTVSDEEAETILRNSGVQAETYSDDAILIARSYGIQGGLQGLGEQALVGVGVDDLDAIGFEDTGPPVDELVDGRIGDPRPGEDLGGMCHGSSNR